MEITKKSGLLLEIRPPEGKPFDVATSDLIAAIAATVGVKNWLQDLTSGHLKITHTLYKQNAGVIGSEPYNREDEEEGEKLEELCGAIARKLMDLRDESERS
jgi:hypothetical protein